MDKANFRKDLNLLDRVSEKVLKSNVKGMFALIIVIIVVFLILVGIFVPKMVLSTKQAEYDNLQKQLATNKVYETEYEELQGKIQVAQAMLADLNALQNGGLSRVFRLIEETMPATGIKISSIQVVSDSVVTLSGVANDENTIADYVTQLKQNKNIYSVTVSGADSEYIFGKEVQSFTITFSYAFVD